MFYSELLLRIMKIDRKIYYEIYSYLSGLLVAAIIRFLVLYGIAIVLVRALRLGTPNPSIIPLALSFVYILLEATALRRKVNLAISSAKARIAYERYEEETGILDDHYRHLLAEIEGPKRLK